MKLTSTLLSALAVLTLLSSGCVSQKKYRELELVKQYYEAQADEADSVRMAMSARSEEDRQRDAQLNQSIRELEQLTATNQSLNRSYQDLLSRYNAMLDQNKDVLSTSSFEKQGLVEQVASLQQQLDQKLREVSNLENELAQQTANFRSMEGTYRDLQSNLSQQEQKVRELSTLLSQQEKQMSDLRNRINQALLGFQASDLSVTEKNGKIYVSLSQNLLFSTGSSAIDWKGKKALIQLSEVLNANPDIDITVEGHTDTDGTADKNWALSAERAIEVVKVLTANKVDPKRITASGRAFYAPVAGNATADGKAQNRRTEIILSPKLDQLYRILGNNAGK